MTLPAWARDWILKAEGGLVDDPADPGGLTNYGISKRAYPNLDIAHLTPDDADRIYARDYWDRVRADDLLILPAVALAVFDSAVNQGPAVAVRLLQASLGVHVDGEIGPETLAAVRARAEGGTEHLLVQFLSRRAEHYAMLAQGNLNLRKFTRGWFVRLFRLHAACRALADAA